MAISHWEAPASHAAAVALIYLAHDVDKCQIILLLSRNESNGDAMQPSELKAWRERVRLTQQEWADKLKVSRMTVINWESGNTSIPPAVEMSCQVWEARLKQQDPNLGPVTLIYSDGPMFINPYGPRGKLAMMQQEPYPTNAMAIARVQKLWGRNDFHNPFVIEGTGTPLWNAVELGRVVDGTDTGAPTLTNLLRAIALRVRDNSENFVRDGAKMPMPTELKKQKRALERVADELEELADGGLEQILSHQIQIEDAFVRLRSLGSKAPDVLVRNVAQAFVAMELN